MVGSPFCGGVTLSLSMLSESTNQMLARTVIVPSTHLKLTTLNQYLCLSMARRAQPYWMIATRLFTSGSHIYQMSCRHLGSMKVAKVSNVSKLVLAHSTQCPNRRQTTQTLNLSSFNLTSVVQLYPTSP